MSELTRSFKDSWTNPTCFYMYEERRGLVEPALAQLVGNVVADTFETGSTILEVGAGAGALRRYAGEIGDHFNWIESDHWPGFLQLPRSIDSPRVVAALPDLPLRPSSLDGIISLGVLDTLSDHDLTGTAEAASWVLAPGGKLVHLLDMTPDYVAEIKNAGEEGLFPFIYQGDDQDKTLGIHYVTLKNLPRRISRLPIDRSLRNVFTAIVTDPEQHVPKTNRTGILQLLGATAAEYGMVVRSEDSWLGTLSAKLATVFEAQGFTVTQNHVAVTEVVVNEEILPATLRGQGATHIVRKQGYVSVLRDDKALLLPGKVKMRADSQVFVAQKSSS